MKYLNATEVLPAETNKNGFSTSNELSDVYLIGPGDTLYLDISDILEVRGEYNVMSDGNVYLPLIGGVNLNYKSVEQAKEILYSKYSNEMIEPIIYLSVIKPRSVQVTVLGEIDRPGSYKLIYPAGSSFEIPSIIDAIQKAGGITQYTNLKEVSIKRRLPGNKELYKQANINLLDFILKGSQRNNLLLFDGDIITLKKAQILPEEIILAAKTNFFPEEIKINVSGEIKNAGLLTVKSGTTISQAIYLAGGPIDWKTGNVLLARLNDNGSIYTKKFRINLSESISDEKNPVLKNGDIIHVQATGFSKVSSSIKVITEPMSGLVTALSLFKLIND